MTLDEKYLELANDIVQNGTIKENRTGTDTISISGAMIKHNMADGFPLLTTKRVFYKAMVVELEGFLKGITDKRWFIERGCNIWNEWQRPDTIPEGLSDADRKEIQLNGWDLGPLGYSFQLRSFGGDYKNVPQPESPYSRKVVINNKITDSLLGKKMKSNNYGPFVVIDKINDKYLIKFILTGYERKYKKKYLIKGEVKDLYYPIVFNAGALGENYKTDVGDKLKSTWNNMVSRCYNENDKDYPSYGGKNIIISDRWLVFSNFIEDAVTLDGWDLKVLNWDEFTLDKDLSEDKKYSKGSCKWISKKEQAENRENSILFDVTFPNGKVLKGASNLKCFCIANDLDYSNCNKRLNGKWKYKIKGFDFTNKQTKLKSKNINKGFDQLENLLQTLKNNPKDRRMVISHWNPIEHHRMALPACHFEYQLIVREDKLDLIFNMRSVDVFLGLPFNISSYGLLLSLLAKQFGYEPGTLTGFFGDTHLYVNHLDQIKEQTANLPNQKKLPTLKISDEMTDVKYFNSLEDLELIDYRHCGIIRGVVAI